MRLLLVAFQVQNREVDVEPFEVDCFARGDIQFAFELDPPAAKVVRCVARAREGWLWRVAADPGNVLTDQHVREGAALGNALRPFMRFCEMDPDVRRDIPTPAAPPFSLPIAEQDRLA